MVNWSYDVTEEDLAEYEKERKAQLEWFAKNAPEGVKYDWNPPRLNPDGSLARANNEEIQANMAKNANSPETWAGTRRGSAATATVVRKVD